MFAERTAHGVTYMTAPNIEATHAFTIRIGGVSGGVYATMNLGINRGDDPSRVRENYDIICRVLCIRAGDIVCSRQVHGKNVRVVTREDCGDVCTPSPCEADGLITNEPGVALMVFTADCVPILLHDSQKGVIAAIHAGWRGTAMDIAGEAVRKMAKIFGCDNIQAAIGPCISKCCFETDKDVQEALYDALGEEAGYCIESLGDKFMVDLKEANRLLLIRAGVRDIAVSDECTACLPEKYWSHRRMGTERGSQAAIIAMRGSKL
ncbi:MAG: peptidoglycan editing factor PgeF [Oscillospiraceae bacterium]|nr:peptidoglycan editing factor PgeF [Oscillospiraceae bacterium]